MATALAPVVRAASAAALAVACLLGAGLAVVAGITYAGPGAGP